MGNWRFISTVIYRIIVDEIKEIIKKLHHCEATYLETVPVKETFKNQTVWEGKVEVFSLTNHPKTNKCYAWQYIDDQGDQQFVTVLEIPPVNSPLKAVQAAIVSENKTKLRS